MDRVLKVILVLLGVAFVILQGMAYEFEGAAVGVVMLILLLMLHYKYTSDKDFYFSGFLLVFALGQLLNCIGYYAPEIKPDELDYYYYGTNLFYILSYILLIVKVSIGLNFKILLKELWAPIIVLIVLDVFCVTLVTDTTKGTSASYVLEYVYNAVVMALLSVALIDYMYRNDNKSMLFLVGSICIVFSEIIQLAYYYVLKNNNLGFIYALFLVIAFALFYLQSRLQFTGPEPRYLDDHIEV